MTDRHPTDASVSPRLSRRAALRLWGGRVVPMMLLAACAGPTSAQTIREPAGHRQQSAPSRGGRGAAAQEAGQSAARQESIGQPACVLTPQQTEGPYFVDERLNRSDIRGNPADGALSEGIPLTLTLHVSQVNGGSCTPLAGLFVDVWQCDAKGVYSDVQDRNWGTSRGSQFLRGYQVTDEQGVVQFTTIYPGWYRGRAAHIHFKVRTALDGGRQQVSQFYFDDTLSDEVFQQPPYAAMGTGRTRNSQDGIYRSGGDVLTLQCVQDADGYAATYHLGVNLA
ncbi:MAG: intradiol ring-cleavage dioxygenase [Chloroflexi bacterium]|nr:intradiol ring-cleavage dioxygenase [Chloroflexota bacterium]